MSFVKKGVIIPLGAGADNSYVYNPVVLFFNNKYRCYYSGAGSAIRIFHAESEDGVHFTKKGVVIGVGSAGQIDSTNAYGHCPIIQNNKIYMYYTAQGTADNKQRIALAISTDGEHFIKKGVVIGLGAEGESDDNTVFFGTVIKLNNKFYCYYSSDDGNAAGIRMAIATSKDGLHFIKKGVVIPLGANGEIDDKFVAYTSILYRNNKIYSYYSGDDGAGTRRVCFSSSKDGLHFTKKGVVIPLGSGGQIDSSMLNYPSVIVKNNKFYCNYNASTGINRAALAISKTAV